MTYVEPTRAAADAEILRLRLRLEEVRTALRNQQATFNDMLERLQRREEEAVTLAAERAARTVAESAAQRLGFLAQASAALASSLDYETTLTRLAQLAVPVVADYATVDLLDDHGQLQRVAMHHRDPAQVAAVRRMQERYPTPPDAPAGVPKVLRTRQPDVGLDVPDSLLVAVARNEEHLRMLRDLQIRSYIVVPLIAHDHVLGALTVVYAESERRYTAADVALMEDLARRAAVAIENARLVRRLELTRSRLEEQTRALEAQTRELQHATQVLQENADELRQANMALAAATREAQHAREVAEAANAAKSQFLSMMSHELRTPLNAIAGYGQLLTVGVYGPVTDNQMQALERIRRSQERLLRMIDDMLNFARIEAGKLEVHLADVKMTEIFDAVDMVMRPQIELKGLIYEVAGCDADVYARADRDKLEQILLNLLTNAMKFTGTRGRIGINCTATPRTVYVNVTDTGRGIPADKLEHIFDPFVQVDTRRTMENQGVGLGLAISRELARAMGAELRVASMPGQGTTFTLELPRTNAP